MKVTVLPGRVIDTGKAAHKPGDTLDVSDSDGKRLIALGACAEVKAAAAAKANEGKGKK